MQSHSKNTKPKQQNSIKSKKYFNKIQQNSTKFNKNQQNSTKFNKIQQNSIKFNEIQKINKTQRTAIKFKKYNKLQKKIQRVNNFQKPKIQKMQKKKIYIKNTKSDTPKSANIGNICHTRSHNSRAQISAVVLYSTSQQAACGHGMFLH